MVKKVMNIASLLNAVILATHSKQVDMRFAPFIDDYPHRISRVLWRHIIPFAVL
ncbi:MAG: hypothetical protein ACPG7F_19935 [Aggregatilineales bacterium]